MIIYKCFHEMNGGYICFNFDTSFNGLRQVVSEITEVVYISSFGTILKGSFSSHIVKFCTVRFFARYRFLKSSYFLL